MRKIVLLTVTVIILMLGINMTAKVVTAKEKSISREQYRILEEEYKNEVRMILLEKGCKNAGIMLTYVEDAEGTRDYTVTLCHAKLDKMEDADMLLLKARLQESGQEILMANVIIKRIDNQS